jgi:Zn-dependent protease
MSERAAREAKRRGPYGLRLGSVAGIEVRLDASIVLIFALIVVSLAESLFPSWHPDWGRLLTWATAAGAAVAFFASLLLHELAHSLMARRMGIAVPRITLFVFGGMAELSAEPKTPRAEFLIAIVGPLASLALGVVFAVFAASLTPATFAETMMADPERAIAHLGALATICVWLAPVNVALAVFNLLPGFPLDGGRVLRAVIWWAKGDQVVATRRAAQSGRAFSWLLIAYGIVNLFWGRAIDGVWFIVIGWFLGNAAQMGYQQLLLRRALHGLVVGDLMRTHFETVDAEVGLADFVEERLLRSAQGLWPVLDGGRLAGVISQADVVACAEADRSRLTVRDAMRRIDGTAVIGPDLSGPEAYERLSAMADEPVPVVARDRVVGLLHGADILRWISLHQMRMNA